MPNWCTNTLTITSKSKRLINKDFNFSKFFPSPFPDDESTEWCLENWGCSWDIIPQNTQVIDYGSNHLQLQFLTPWGPPISFLKKLSVVFPKASIVLYYSEPGIWFSGFWEYNPKTKSIYHDDSVDYNIYAEESGNVRYEEDEE